MKKSFNWFIVILFIAFLLQLTRSITDLWERGSVMEHAEEKLERVRNENKTLQRQLQDTESLAFIEKQAREKLNLARSDEVIAIITNVSPTPQPSPVVVPKQNWEQWLDVFRISWKG